MKFYLLITGWFKNIYIHIFLNLKLGRYIISKQKRRDELYENSRRVRGQSHVLEK